VVEVVLSTLPKPARGGVLRATDNSSRSAATSGHPAGTSTVTVLVAEGGASRRTSSRNAVVKFVVGVPNDFVTLLHALSA
jgi:hypothetical protein